MSIPFAAPTTQLGCGDIMSPSAFSPEFLPLRISKHNDRYLGGSRLSIAARLSTGSARRLSVLGE